MKNFLGAKFQLFGQNHLQTFLSKNRQKSPKKFFKVFFGQNAKKNWARAPAVAFEIINSGLEKDEMS